MNKLWGREGLKSTMKLHGEGLRPTGQPAAFDGHRVPGGWRETWLGALLARYGMCSAQHDY